MSMELAEVVIRLDVICEKLDRMLDGHDEHSARLRSLEQDNAATKGRDKFLSIILGAFATAIIGIVVQMALR